jgi:sec-independent protein translocase protein TatB
MSSGELLLTALVASLVLGPKQLPVVARQMGLLLRQLTHYKQQFSLFLAEQDQERQLQENLKKAAEADQHYP